VENTSWHRWTTDTVNIEDIIGYLDKRGNIIDVNRVYFFKNLTTEDLVRNRGWKTVQKQGNDFWD
jgi:hypothetical protein